MIRQVIKIGMCSGSFATLSGKRQEIRAEAVYAGNPIDGYTLKRSDVGFPRPAETYISWQQVQDMIRMKTHYIVTIMSEEDSFIDQI